jgi:hypothetical protein
VPLTVRLLCRSAEGGDLAAAKALIPWLNQALGMPTERVEHRPPSTLQELEQMDTAELERLVARGRERRLRAARAVPGTAGAEGQKAWYEIAAARAALSRAVAERAPRGTSFGNLSPT